MLDKDFIQEKFLSLLNKELYVQINSVIAATVYISGVKKVEFNLDQPEGMNCVVIYYGDMTFEFTVDYIESISEVDDYLEEDEEFAEDFEFLFQVKFDDGTVIHIYKNNYVDVDEESQ